MSDCVDNAYNETITVFGEWKDQSVQTINWLNSQIENAKHVRKNVNISNLVGSSMGIVGGTIAVVGTALIPFTAGISSALIFAGMGIAIPGAGVTIGSSVTEAVITKNIKEDDASIKFGETNLNLDRLLNELKKLIDDQNSLCLFSESNANLVHEILSGMSLLRSIGLVASFTDDIAKVAFIGNITAARTLGVVVGSVAGGIGLTFDFANLGLTIHNMVAKKNSTRKSDEMEQLVQQIMRKGRIVDRILEKVEAKLHPGRFCVTCDERIDEKKGNFITCSNEHNMCKNCFIFYCTDRIKNKQTEFPCPNDICGTLFDRKICELHLPIEVVMKWNKELYRRAISEAKENIDLLIWCRYCGSPYQLLCTRRENDTLFECKNPECHLHFCVNPDCEVRPSRHHSLSCEDAKKREEPEERIRKSLEEKITQITVRTCSNCFKECQKTEGCNFVRCDCGVAMCYLCRAPNIEYNHFHSYHKNECPPGCKACFLETEPDIIDEVLIMQYLNEAERNGVPEMVIQLLRNRLTDDDSWAIIG